MATVCVYSASKIGIRVIPIQIEVDIQPGLPQFAIIGLPDKQIGEAKDRVKSAIKNSGFKFPLGKITINLSPSHIPKYGTWIDTAIAIGILQASKLVPRIERKIWIFGELALNGQIRKIENVPQFLASGLREEVTACLLPKDNQEEAKTIYEMPVLFSSNLVELIEQIKRGEAFIAFEPDVKQGRQPTQEYLFDFIRGQAQAKRCLLIALAGGHNLFLFGPPGSGKTMLAKSAVELLPELNRKEYVDSIAQGGELTGIPFRAPHSSINKTQLLGDSSGNKIGEMILANNGILFLDEFSHIKKEVRECLRQPLESRTLQRRIKGADFTDRINAHIIAAQNRCPCGKLGDLTTDCVCAESEIERYNKLISEPLLDRFDLFCNMDKITVEEMRFSKSELNGEVMVREINNARIMQVKRLGAKKTNAQMNQQEITRYCILGKQEAEIIQKCSEAYYLSGRGITKILSVARTIADLEEKENLTSQHIQEAVQYRRRH